MVFIGWYAFKRTSSLTDYMLGGRSLGPGDSFKCWSCGYVGLVADGSTGCNLSERAC